MSNYDDFMSRFRVKNVQVVRDRMYDTINYGYNQTASYYADREELIEMELTRSGFEELVRMDTEYTRSWQDESDARYLRKMHPALKEAYDKYQMLLAIYK
jgi:hypothetical protein